MAHLPMKLSLWESPLVRLGKRGVVWGLMQQMWITVAAPQSLSAILAMRKSAFFYAKSEDTYFTDRSDNVQIGNVSFRSLTFGILFFDSDLDGTLDLFCVNGHIEPEVLRYQQHTPYAQPPSLFRNNGDGTFQDITKQAGFTRSGVGRGCAYGDYDNDGDLDLLVQNNGVTERLRQSLAPCVTIVTLSSNYLRVRTSWHP